MLCQEAQQPPHARVVFEWQDAHYKEFVRFFQALWHTIHTQDDVDIHEYVRDLSKQKRMAIKAIEDGHGDVADVPALPMYLQRGGGGGGASGSGKKRRRKDAGVDADGDKAKRAKKPAARRNKGGKSLPKQRRQARPAAATPAAATTMTVMRTIRVRRSRARRRVTRGRAMTVRSFFCRRCLGNGRARHKFGKRVVKIKEGVRV